MPNVAFWCLLRTEFGFWEDQQLPLPCAEGKSPFSLCAHSPEGRVVQVPGSHHVPKIWPTVAEAQLAGSSFPHCFPFI